MQQNIENMLKNIENIGKNIGLPNEFIDKRIDQFKVIMKEQEAKNKANQTNSGNNEEKEDLSISEILNKFAVKESNSNKFPSINVLEENSTYIYLIDLPGIQKESISIEIKDNRILSISAERTKPANLTANESYFGVINRDIELPENYSGEVLASYENGVLSLMIEKKQNTVKKINII